MDIKGIWEPLGPDGSDHIPNEAHLLGQTSFPHYSSGILRTCHGFGGSEAAVHTQGDIHSRDTACAGASSHPSPWEGAGSHSHVLLGQFPWEIDSSGILPMAYFIFPYPKLKSAQCDLGMCRNYIFRSLQLYPSHQPPFIHRQWAGWPLKTFHSMPFHAIPVGSHGH